MCKWSVNAPYEKKNHIIFHFAISVFFVLISHIDENKVMKSLSDSVEKENHRTHLITFFPIYFFFRFRKKSKIIFWKIKNEIENEL